MPKSANQTGFAVSSEIEPENVLTVMTSADHTKILKIVA